MAGPRSMPGSRSSTPVVPHAPKWHQRLVATLIFLLERLLTATLRVRWQDNSRLEWDSNARPRIFCIWHNRLALSMFLYRQKLGYTNSPRPLAALVSASRDGALLAAILGSFGVQAVRGSSSRRGHQALLELVSVAEQGFDLAITPDGPRGPCYSVQDGIIAAAQVTGHMIVPVSYSCSRKISLRSWDRFQVPLPFSKCVIRLGPPIHVPRELSDNERQAVRNQIQEAMRLITED